jgi:hypothetical protein
VGQRSPSAVGLMRLMPSGHDDQPQQPKRTRRPARGKCPLANANAVFALASEHLGRHLRLMSDGETGKRINWTHLVAGCVQSGRRPVVGAARFWIF